MANLRTLRQRIRSVQSTQKITRAMQMVAGAKLRRLQEEFSAFRPYAAGLTELTQRFLAAHPDLNHPLLEAPVSDTALPAGLVVVTSDTGLCGTYNDRVVALAEGFIKEHPSALVVTIGRKGNRALHRRGIPRAQEILDWGGRYDLTKVGALLEWLESLYRAKRVGSWWVASTQFISAIRWKPSVERLLPIERPTSFRVPGRVILEPDLKTIADELLNRFVRAAFRHALLSAFTAEHATRMIAMKNATDNAAEMIDGLTLVRNKVRQAAITKELIEVVSGAEALK